MVGDGTQAFASCWSGPKAFAVSITSNRARDESWRSPNVTAEEPESKSSLDACLPACLPAAGHEMSYKQ